VAVVEATVAVVEATVAVVEATDAVTFANALSPPSRTPLNRPRSQRIPLVSTAEQSGGPLNNPRGPLNNTSRVSRGSARAVVYLWGVLLLSLAVRD